MQGSSYIVMSILCIHDINKLKETCFPEEFWSKSLISDSDNDHLCLSLSSLCAVTPFYRLINI